MRVLDRLRRSATLDAPMLPYLRPGRWPLVHACANQLLLRFGPGEHTPYVVVGRDTGDGVDLVRYDALGDLGMSWPELLAFAVDNLSSVPATWDVVHRDEGTDRPLLLGFEGDGVTSASRVLDPHFTARAHDLVRSNILLVSVPDNRHLFVADGSPFAHRDLAVAFRTWSRRHFEASEGIDALSPQVFVMRDGRIVGTYKPAADG